MQLARRVSAAVFLTIASSASAFSQIAPPEARMISLAGPRVGATFLSDGVVKALAKDDQVSVAPLITQFGWQFEKQFYSGTDGLSALTEAVVLFGGLEQGYALPSLSWLVGVRTREGTEFGVGPNITPIGTALVLAAGKTFRMGVLNVPVNVAVVPSKSGVRVSMLTGFSLRQRGYGRP